MRNWPELNVSLLKHLFQLDMHALTERGVMPLPGGKERVGFLCGRGLDPPFLGPGHQQSGVKGPQFGPRRVFARG